MNPNLFWADLMAAIAAQASIRVPRPWLYFPTQSGSANVEIRRDKRRSYRSTRRDARRNRNRRLNPRGCR